VLTASDILAEAALLAGFDVEKGRHPRMSQRGGSVSQRVRFGEKVLSRWFRQASDFSSRAREDQVDNNFRGCR